MSRFEPKVRWWSATTRSLSRFTPARRPHARRRLSLECLEDRTVLFTIALTVTTLLDDPTGGVPISGYTTLRDAITQADNGATSNQYVVTFSVSGTIDLTSPLPNLSNNIDLDGPGASDLTVQRDPSAAQFSIFTVDSSVTVSLSGMTISGGNAGRGDGGGIDNSGMLTVNDSVFSGNSANLGNGGGIANESGGTLTVSNSVFSNNSVLLGGAFGALGNAGAMFNSGMAKVTDSTFTGNYGGIDNYTGGTITVSNSTFTNNSDYGGGGLDNAGTMTVSGSTIIDNSASSYGAGISNENGATLTVIDSTFSGNSTSLALGGGAMFNSGMAKVADSTFASNDGGIYNYTGGTITVSNSTFTDNISENGGGGIYNSGTSTVTDSTFAGNAGWDGGGLFNYFGTATVNGSTFIDNFASGVGANDIGGGGMYNYSGGTLTVSDSTFIDNSASASGGGIYNYTGGTVTVTDSTFTGNSAGSGGGMYNYRFGTLTVSVSTFTGNSASVDGGGIYNDSSGTATVTNCTFSGNTSQDGGGIADDDGGNLTLNNTIVAGNTSTSTSNDDISGPIESTSAFNLIGDGSGISNLTDLEEPALGNLIGTTADPINPLLAPLADYGGPTQTMALLPGSPAIDAGSNALAVDANGNPLTTDQRGAGFPRVVNGTVDIGAFESQGFALTPVTGSTPQGTPVNSPFANPLAVIVTANNPLEPVAGGIVTFSAPASGASAELSTTSPVTIGSDGQASVTATANAIGGQYTVSASTAGAATPAAFVLTNQFLSQTISFGPLADQTYGVAPITLSATDTSDLPVSFTVLSGPATLSGSVLTVTGAGNVVVEASQPGNATYSAAAPVDESFTVNPAPLKVTATGESMTYGGTVPALSYTYTGLVNGDPSATFSGGLATSATSSSNVGGYPITQGTLAATGNYTIGTFNPGTLTVNAAPLTITPTAGQSMVYGSTVPALAYTSSGFVNGDPASLLTGELGTTATSTSVVGNYLFTLGSLTAGTNYALALAVNSPTFAVTPDGTTTQLASSANPSSFGQAVTLTATVTANAPGSGSPTGTVTFYVGPVNPADQIGSTGTLSSSSGVMTASVSTSSLPVGTDTITATYSGDGDFLTSTGTLTITINQSIIVLDPSAGGALSLAGNACISVPGVVYVDSSSSTALSASGNAQVKAAVIDVHGKVQKSGNASFSPAPVTGAPILANPLASLALPSTSGLTNYGSESLSGNSSATIKPGIYSQISVSGNAKLTLSSGIYIIEGGGFSVSGNASVSGSGVMIVNAGSKYPTTGGTYGSIALGGSGSYNLSPLSNGAYAGIVIFQPGDNANALSVSGNASGMTGAIYAPAAQLAESGNAQLDSVLVVDTLTVGGNGVVNSLPLVALSSAVGPTVTTQDLNIADPPAGTDPQPARPQPQVIPPAVIPAPSISSSGLMALDLALADGSTTEGGFRGLRVGFRFSRASRS